MGKEMSDPGDSSPFPFPIPGAAPGSSDSLRLLPTAPGDLIDPLMNLSAVISRMETLHRFLSDSVHRNVLLGRNQMDFISNEISSAIHQVIINGAALLASSCPRQIPNLPRIRDPNSFSSQIENSNSSKDHPEKISVTIPIRVGANSSLEDPKSEPVDEDLDDNDGSNKIDDGEVVELDAVELLAEHVHLCDICGKGFKRDANLRMHMRAHGDQFKRPEALAKPPTAELSSGAVVAIGGGGGRKTKFSCPFAGCNRNKQHKKFRPLKSVICARIHFRRSHCPKMYSCDRCNKKSFSVLADLKSHLKHCGESKWKCSCGTTFLRKDKLFGHMALFEGHMPVTSDGDHGERLKSSVVVMEEDAKGKEVEKESELEKEVGATGYGNENDNRNGLDDRFFDGFGLFDSQTLEEMLGSYSPDFVQHFCNS